MALFRIKTDTEDYTLGNTAKSDKEIANTITRVLAETSAEQPNSKVIEVKVVDKKW